jgi:hypothetical protein
MYFRLPGILMTSKMAAAPFCSARFSAPSDAAPLSGRGMLKITAAFPRTSRPAKSASLPKPA